MPKKPPIGLMTCPDCDFPDAEVREDRNAHLYRYCPGCNAQTFTRGDKVRTDNMKKKMRAVPAQREAAAAESPASVTPPAPPARAQSPAASPAPASAPAKKPSPFDPTNW